MSTWQKHTDKTLQNVVQLRFNFHAMSGLIEAQWDKWILSYNIIAQNGTSKSQMWDSKIPLLCDWSLQYGLKKVKWLLDNINQSTFFFKCTWMRNNAWRRRLNNMSAMILLMLGNGCALHPETSKAKSAISCNRQEQPQVSG